MKPFKAPCVSVSGDGLVVEPHEMNRGLVVMFKALEQVGPAGECAVTLSRRDVRRLRDYLTRVLETKEGK